MSEIKVESFSGPKGSQVMPGITGRSNVQTSASPFDAVFKNMVDQTKQAENTFNRQPAETTGRDSRQETDTAAAQTQDRQTDDRQARQADTRRQDDRRNAEKTVDSNAADSKAAEQARQADKADRADRNEQNAADNAKKAEEKAARAETDKADSAEKTVSPEKLAKAREDMTPETILNITGQQLIDKLQLTEKQAGQMANKLGLSLAEFKQMNITVQFGGKEPMIKGALPNGNELDLAKALNLTEKEGQFVGAKEAVERIAKALDIQPEKAQQMVKELGLDKLELRQTAFTNHQKRLLGDNGVKKVEEKADTGPFLRKDAAQSEATAKAMKDSLTQKAEDVQSPKAQFEELAAMKDQAAKNAQASKAGGQATMASAKADDGATQFIKAGSEGGLKIDGAGNITKMKPMERPVPQFSQETANKVLNQIVEKARVINLPNQTEARLTLSPAQLGSMDIKIIVHDAQMKGNIVVENQQVKQIVEQNIDQLKASFADQGIKLSEMNVEINNRQAAFDNQGGADGRSAQGGFGKGDGGAGGNGGSDYQDGFSHAEAERLRKEARNSLLYMHV